MGPYGSVWADIKTGKSPMAPDHFQTPPDPKRGYKNQKKIKKVFESVPNQPRYGTSWENLTMTIRKQDIGNL